MSNYKKQIIQTVPHAPYNFVPFANEVIERYSSYEELPKHNTLEQGRYTGTISYNVEADSSIFIGSSQNGEFYRDINDEIAIPASTIRGLVRFNMRILGLASAKNDIQDTKLMYRVVGQKSENPLKKKYDTILGAKTQSLNGKSISILERVKSGYLKKENGKYVIYKTKEDKNETDPEQKNYFVLREKEIAKNIEEENNYMDYFKTNKVELCSYIWKDNKYVMNTNGDPKKCRVNKNYTPFYDEITYQNKDERTVIEVKSKGLAGKKGYITVSGGMNNKKAVYIIPEMSSEVAIELSEKDIESYNVDWNMKKNILKNSGIMKSGLGINKNYFELPQEEGTIRPVFYIQYEGKVYFGFTPRLRLFFEHSILEGLPDAQKNKHGMDYVQSIFGFIDGEQSYRSRVQFFDAPKGGNKQVAEFWDRLILGEPKPTSYLDYLKNKTDPKKVATYNDIEFQLRGVKQYWFHKEDPKDGKENRQNGTSQNDNVASKIHALEKGVSFEGKIHFQNLAKDELGLLLWSLCLEENSLQNIGKGKGYGYGRVKITVNKLEVQDVERSYFNFESLDFHTKQETLTVKECIQYYKEKFKEETKKEAEKYPSIKNFLIMKSKNNLLERDKVAYMDLKEYSNRLQMLPSINEVVEVTEQKKKEQKEEEKIMAGDLDLTALGASFKGKVNKKDKNNKKR